MGVKNLDYLKIVAQGAELDILQGLGEIRPLAMRIQVEFLPNYKDMPNGYELMSYIFNIGYIPFSIGRNINPLAPSISDAVFMPNWTTEAGRQMIMQREKQYIALMLMYGQVHILKFVSEKIKMKHSTFIKKLPFR